MKNIKNIFSKCEQIHSVLTIHSYLPMEFLVYTFISYAVILKFLVNLIVYRSIIPNCEPQMVCHKWHDTVILTIKYWHKSIP